MAASSYGRRSHIGLGQAPDIQCLPTGRRLHIRGYIPFEKKFRFAVFFPNRIYPQAVASNLKKKLELNSNF